MQRRILILLLVLAASAAVGVWHWRQTRRMAAPTASMPDPAITLHVALGVEPSTLDPALARTLPETLLVLALFEGLYTFDPKTLEPRPALAESARASSDGHTWTFTLREARWSNGDRVTADDFVWSWHRARSAELRAPYARLFAPIRAVSADGNRTLVVELWQPAPWLPSLLCFPPFLPVHRPTVEGGGSTWTAPGRLVSNGPFLLRSRRWHDTILLTKNPSYRSADRVRLSGVRLFTAIASSRAVEQFDAGEIDWVWTASLSKVGALRSRAEWLSSIRLSVRFLRFHARAAPFHDARLRRAVSLALDRDELVRMTSEAPAWSFVPPGIPGYEAPTLVAEVEAARRLLDDAGYPRGSGLPPIELACVDEEPTLRLAKAVAVRLRSTLGIDVRPVPLEAAEHQRQERDLAYRHMILSLRGAEVLDPWTFLSAFVSGGSENRTGWRSAWYDEIVSQAAVTTDTRARMDLYREAERVLVQDEAAVVPLSFPREEFLLKRRVSGVWPNGLGVHPLGEVAIEPTGGDQ